VKYQGFRWELDNWWVELLRLDELGLPPSWNILVPDKLMHFSSTFLLVWLLGKLTKRWWAGALIGYAAIMMTLWEVVLDGMFRYGASWKDMVANTLGAACAVWWLNVKTIGQLPKKTN